VDKKVFVSLLRKEDDNMIEAIERLLYQAFPCKTWFTSQAGSDGVSIYLEHNGMHDDGDFVVRNGDRARCHLAHQGDCG
jgi:hypothetical protein